MMDVNEPVVQYLCSARAAKAEYRRKLRRVEELKSQCESMTAHLGGTGGGGGSPHGPEGLWALLADEITRMRDAAEEELRRYSEVESFIDRLPAAEHRLLLKFRYLDGMKWGRVWREMQKHKFYYSERQLYRKRDAALAEAGLLYRSMREGGVLDGVYPEAASEILH